MMEETQISEERSLLQQKVKEVIAEVGKVVVGRIKMDNNYFSMQLYGVVFTLYWF